MQKLKMMLKNFVKLSDYASVSLKHPSRLSSMMSDVLVSQVRQMRRQMENVRHLMETSVHCHLHQVLLNEILNVGNHDLTWQQLYLTCLL